MRVPPAPQAVLTTAEAAKWLQVSERSVERHFVPVLPGRYLTQHILDRLEELRREAAPSKAT